MYIFVLFIFFFQLFKEILQRYRFGGDRYTKVDIKQKVCIVLLPIAVRTDIHKLYNAVGTLCNIETAVFFQRKLILFL